MEQELAQGKLGAVGNYDVAFTGGKLVVSLNASEGPLEEGVVLKLDAGKVMDALASALPGGPLVAQIIGVAKAALLGK